ncbi:hypothetical protein BVI434_2920003 [Burkholderia vietnamiensis]|nr:hypothetical protein BVI434_2920003 [Burkholderia vietnamiensis]
MLVSNGFNKLFPKPYRFFPISGLSKMSLRDYGT